jgi:hypothetical protein
MDWTRLRTVCKSNTFSIVPDKYGNVILPNGQVFHFESETTAFKFIPIVNVVHDFLDSAPPASGVQLILNIVVVMNALMLSAAFGLPKSLGSYDDAKSTIARFNGEGEGNEYYNKWCVKNYGNFNEKWKDDQCGWSMMINFTYQSTMAASFLGASILCAICLYTLFSVTSFIGPDGATSRNMMKSWWRPVQFAILASIILTGGGIMYIFGSVKMLATFNYPDYFLDADGVYEFSNSGSDPRNTLNFYNNQSYAWPVSFFLIGLVCASAGLVLKSRTLKKACEKLVTKQASGPEAVEMPRLPGTNM